MAVNLYRSLAIGSVTVALTGCAGQRISPETASEAGAGAPAAVSAERAKALPLPTEVTAAAIDCKAFDHHRAKWHARQHTVGLLPPSVAAMATPDATGTGDDDEEDDEEDASSAIPFTLADVPLFSAAQPGLLPHGWQAWTVSRNKRPTQYNLTEYDKRLVVHAQADSSASGLYVPLEGRDAGVLRWTWKTNGIIKNADNSHGPREDAPLRIFAAFDGDTSTLSLKDQLLYEMARITTGREMPYATLMYIWGGKRPEGTVLPNPHTDRVRMIVVDSGTRHANQWRCHERDLRADFRKAFGKEPGRLVAIGIMTDTDNTKSRAEAWYGDIALD